MNCTARKPECDRRSLRRRPALIILPLLLASCATPPAPGPGPDPAEVIPEEPVVPEPDPVVIRALEPEPSITEQEIEGEGPWELARRADQATLDVAIDLRLDAIDGFLAMQEFTPAETQTNYLLDVPLNRTQFNRFNLQRGRIALGFGEYPTAIKYLQPLRDDPLWSPKEWALVLKSLADAHLGLDQRVDALTHLLLRDRLLVGAPQLASQRRLIDLLGQTSSLEQALLKQNAHSLGLPANLVDGWLQLVALRQLPEHDQAQAAIFWFNSYPGHPAKEEWLGGLPPLSLDTFHHISLLLPLTSPYGQAAQAFQAGFMDAYHRDTAASRPAVRLHDIGQDPSLSAFYYRSAVAAGTEFVVGPLGKEATTVLLQQAPLDTPTLVLSDVPIESSSEGLYGLSLSPERESEQVAFRAFRDGHRQAGILHDGSTRGKRATSAFTDTWLSLGGTVVANQAYSEVVEDYVRLIPQLLEVDKSGVRRKILSAQVGLNLEFTPRRRDDLDMLFLAGRAHEARLLVPQLRFFQAHDLPIYSTSHIFSGQPDPAVDADLDGVIFGDMPWMLDIRYARLESETKAERFAPTHVVAAESDIRPPDDPPIGSVTVSDPPHMEDSSPATGPRLSVPDPAPASLRSDGTQPNQGDRLATDEEVPVAHVLPTSEPEPRPVKKSPFSFTSLDRLYALGLETYHLIPRLLALRQETSHQYYGQAFRASVRTDGNVIRHLQWATFVDGHVVPVERLPDGLSNGPPPVISH